MSGYQFQLAAGHLAGADFRSLHVLQDGYRTPALCGEPAQAGEDCLVVGVCAMREVQAGHIHPGFEQRGEGLLVLAGWTDGSDNLCAALHSHQI